MSENTKTWDVYLKGLHHPLSATGTPAVSDRGDASVITFLEGGEVTALFPQAAVAAVVPGVPVLVPEVSAVARGRK